MPIEQSDLEELTTSWFESVREGIASEAQAASHFVHPHARVVAPDGTTFDMAEHQRLHQGFVDEKHVLGDFELVQICDDPERARAKGWVYYETRYRAHPERGKLKAIAGEEYILERCADGKVRFVQYNATFFATLPDSAPLDLG